MKPIGIIATSVLLCANVAHADFSAADAYRENLAWAKGGDIMAMERLIDGRYQIRFGRFGKRTYEPYSASGQRRDVRKLVWHLPAPERMQWVSRAVDAGSDKFQRFLVLCQQFGCVPCSKALQQCDIEVEPLVARNPEKARELAARYQQDSGNPASWEALRHYLDQMAQLEARVRQGDSAAAAQLSSLSEQAMAQSVGPSGYGWLYPSGGPNHILVLNFVSQRRLTEQAAALGDQASREKLDPAARLAGQGARRASAVGTAREQAQREAALLLELVP